MPHLLNITDGTTTLPLSTTTALLQNYVPQTPQFNEARRLEPVSEPVDLTLYGASASAVQTTYNNLERMLLAARRRQASGVGARVFLQYQPIGDAVLWRSEIREGELRLGRNAMTAYGQAKLPVQVLLERVPYWEGGRTAIPLANGNGSNNTAGLTVWARDDGTAGQDNYTDISAGAITGVLPTPLEIQMRNITGADQGYKNFYIANNTFATGMSHMIEAESFVGGSGTIKSDSTCSNGSYIELLGANLYTWWNLPAALLQSTAGRYVRLMARVRQVLGTVYVRAQIRDYYGLVTLAESPYETVLNRYFCDLGLLPLPPGGYSTSWAQNVLYLSFRSDSPATIELDYLQITPADDLCYRHVEQRGMVVKSNDWVVDDGIEGLQYLIEGGANHGIYTAHTPPVHAFPNTAQRLYFLHDGVSSTASWRLSVKAFYRPRRLTI